MKGKDNNINEDIKKDINSKNVSQNDESSEMSIFLQSSINSNVKKKIDCNSNDIFQTILDDYLKKEKYSNCTFLVALSNGGKVQKNKTLSENNIQNGNTIAIMLNNSSTQNFTILEESNLNNEIIKENKGLKENTEEKENKDEKENKEENNDETKNENEKIFQIKTKKHNHGMVLLYSNKDWVCDICSDYNKNNIPKNYCSLCDFNICNKCINNQIKYPLEKSFHEQIKLTKYKFAQHEHELIYCRTSRFNDKPSNWKCNICNKIYGNKIWSFYCTNCDYDICLSCSRKYIPKEEFINKIGIKIDAHDHRLVFMLTKRSWKCNLCSNSYDRNRPMYYCSNCDYSVCIKCMAKLSDEKKNHIFIYESSHNINLNTVNKNCHEHPLIYCLTNRRSYFSAWICDQCLKKYRFMDWSCYCTLCDYDLCYQCYLK